MFFSRNENNKFWIDITDFLDHKISADFWIQGYSNKRMAIFFREFSFPKMLYSFIRKKFLWKRCRYLCFSAFQRATKAFIDDIFWFSGWFLSISFHLYFILGDGNIFDSKCCFHIQTRNGNIYSELTNYVECSRFLCKIIKTLIKLICDKRQKLTIYVSQQCKLSFKKMILSNVQRAKLDEGKIWINQIFPYWLERSKKLNVKKNRPLVSVPDKVYILYNTTLSISSYNSIFICCSE